MTSAQTPEVPSRMGTADGIPLVPEVHEAPPRGMAADPSVSEALYRLQAAADLVGRGWKPDGWTATYPDGRSTALADLGEVTIVPGTAVEVSAVLSPPGMLHGVNVEGDRLTASVRSIFPTEVLVNGVRQFADRIPTVALGPAAFTVMDAIGDEPATVTMRVNRPIDQGEVWLSWFGVSFTTDRLRRRWCDLDLAGARLRLAAEAASGDAERAAVTQAAASVPLGLDVIGEHDFQDFLHQLDSLLGPFVDEYRDIVVHVVGHAHIDLAWLWTWPDAQQVIARDVKSVLDVMDELPEATFVHSQAAGYHHLAHAAPDLLAAVQARVEAGTWELAAAQWVEADSNLPGAEAAVAQMREAIRFCGERIGTTPRVLLAPDAFGHSANMPQLARQAGIDVYYHMRCNPGGDRPWPAYWWEGLDGSRLLAVSTPTYNGEVTAGLIADAAIRARRAGLRDGLLLVGVGDHGGGPTRDAFQLLRELGGAPGMPVARASTIGGYADSVAPYPLPVHRGESSAIFEGCYTTHADAKQGNRRAENEILRAEAIAALAGMGPDERISQAWQLICFNQFHDIICGSGIATVYRDVADDYRRVRELTEALTADAMKRLRSSDSEVTVINPLGQPVQEVVLLPVSDVTDDLAIVDEAGDPVPVQRSEEGVLVRVELEPFSCRGYTVRRSASGSGGEPAVSVTPGVRKGGARPYFEIDAGRLRAVVDGSSGIITSLYDVAAERELVAYGRPRPTDYGETTRPDLGIGVFQVVTENPHYMSSWQYQEVRSEISLLENAHVRVIEVGAICARLEVEHHYRQSHIRSTISFYRGAPHVDFDVQVDWREPGDPSVGVPNLKLSFLPSIEAAEAWFEIPGGAVRRPANGQQAVAQRWIDVGDADYGVALLNDSCYGFDVLGPRMRATLVRTAYAPDQRSDAGSYRFRFRLLPHTADWRTARIPLLAEAFNQPPFVAQRDNADFLSVTAAGSSSPVVEPRVQEGLASVAVRPGRLAGQMIVRIRELAGRSAAVELRLPDGCTAFQSTILEERGEACRRGVRDEPVRVSVGPWELSTLLVERDRPTDSSR